MPDTLRRVTICVFRRSLGRPCPLAQVVSKARRRRRAAPHQRDVVILTLLIGQLEAVLPVADRLSTSKVVYFLLGGNTRGGMGVKCRWDTTRYQRSFKSCVIPAR